MKTLTRKMMVALIIVCGVVFSAHGERERVVTPLSLALIPDLQFPSNTKSVIVHGLSIGFFGTENHAVKGVQISSVLHSVDTTLYGVQLAGLLNIGVDVVGWQCAGLANFGSGLTGIQTTLGANCVMGFVSGDDLVSGVQIAGVANVAGRMTGIQIAGIMNGAGDVNGIQAAFVYNFCEKEMNGVQLGLLNIATKVNGVQFGLWNQTEDLCGVQIGLININGSRGFPGIMIGW